MAWRVKQKMNWSLIRLLVGAPLLCLFLLLLAGPTDEWLRVARNNLHRHQASGEIVVVRLDNESLRRIGRWPWPRREYAQLIDRLTAAGAKHVAFDMAF